MIEEKCCHFITYQHFLTYITNIMKHLHIIQPIHIEKGWNYAKAVTSLYWR